MIDHAQLVSELVREFPSIEADVRDEVWAGLIHLEVSCFARYTQHQIDSGNKGELQRCFQLARRFILDGTEEVKNAIHVSYLEHLELRDQQKARRWALNEMPQPLRQGYEAIWGLSDV